MAEDCIYDIFFIEIPYCIFVHVHAAIKDMLCIPSALENDNFVILVRSCDSRQYTCRQFNILKFTGISFK